MDKKWKLNEAENYSIGAYIIDIYHYRELIVAFTKKDIIVKLSKTALGKLWLLVQPLITVCIYTIFFGYIIKLQTEGSPYPIFLISGLALWNVFSQSTSLGGNVLIANQEIIKKTPFPKIILNISSILFIIIEQLPFLLIVFILSLLYQKPSLYQIIFIPISYLCIFILSLSVSNIISNLSIKKRDIIYAYTFALQVVVWTTPIFYPTSIIPENYLWILYFNPLVGLLDLFRWSLNIQTLSNYYYIYSIISSFTLLFFSIIIYKRNEKTISDYI